MIDVDRRTAALFALLAPFTAGSACAQTPKSQPKAPDTGRDMDMTGHGSSKVHWMGSPIHPYPLRQG